MSLGGTRGSAPRAPASCSTPRTTQHHPALPATSTTSLVAVYPGRPAESRRAVTGAQQPVVRLELLVVDPMTELTQSAQRDLVALRS